MPPKSAGSPKRRIGMRGITLATNFSLAMMPAVMSLLIQPGRIALAVTPWRASSTASARNSALIAALVPRNARCARCRRATPGSRSPPAGRSCRRPGAFGHVAGRGLEHMEDAVEIDGEHFSPFLVGAVDEGPPSAAADAGIGEAAVDPAERVERAFNAALTEAGSATSQTCGSDLAGTADHGWRGVLFFSALRPQIDTVQPAAPAPAPCRDRCRHCRR